MIKKIFISIFLLLYLSHGIFAHSGKPKYHVIIDTDGAIDDMRAISMLLSDNDVRVLGITCSQGTLLPKDVYVKVKSLISDFHHEGIRIGVGEPTGIKLPVWAPFAKNIDWGDREDFKNNQEVNSTNFLNDISANYKNKITLIALGSLKTYADWIKANSDVAEKIERIIWYNNHDIAKGFNYKAFPESFDFIKKTGIVFEIVSNAKSKLTVNNAYVEEIKKCNSVYAKQIVKVHNQEAVKKKISQNHLQLWDDLVSLYLSVPVLFDIKKENQIKQISLNKAMPEKYVHETIGKLLVSASVTNNRVFTNFPTDIALYKPEYAQVINSTIEKFGNIEWKAIAMTNEIHGHTGIYSIIGAKMGIRAMEYFNVGINNLSVLTFAGSKPPLSCFNDGLQISCGATIGQGLITIADSISIIPSAVFEFNNQKVRISVKKEMADQMRKEIKHGVKTYGLLTEKYWLYIEKLAVQYWSEFDRNEIFEINIHKN